MEMIGLGDTFKLMDENAVAAPNNGTTYALPSPENGKLIGWSTAFKDTAPDACTVKLQHSLDGDNWEDLDESTATAGETRICVLTPAKFVRAVKSAQTNGGALTVRMVATV
jgi:hypothetical protein